MVPPSGTGVAGSVEDGTAPRTIMVSLGTLAAKGFSTAKSPACGAGFSGLPFCANAGTKLAKARINKIAVNFLSMIASLLQAKIKSFSFYTDLIYAALPVSAPAPTCRFLLQLAKTMVANKQASATSSGQN